MHSVLTGLNLLAAVGVWAQPWSPPVVSDLRFDDLFPREPFFGQTARALKWARDARHLAYLWNPYKTRGSDLWIHDAETGRSWPVTSIESMAEFDPEAVKAAKRYREEDTELERLLKLDEKRYREEQVKRRKEDQERKEPQPSYPGVTAFEWANTSAELLFVYRGDIFRWKLGDKKPFRLTKTRDTELDPRWLPDDSGFYFRRGDGLYRMRFDSAVVEQLDPRLPNDLPLWGYSLSPDGGKMMIFTGKSGQYRQHEWVTYRGRFPQVRRDAQYWGTPDEEIKEERYLYLYDLTKPESDENKPWEVWKWVSKDDEVKGVSTGERPWSPDSQRFAFAHFNHLTREIEVVVADWGSRTIETVHQTKFPGEATSASECSPMFMPDGRRLLCLLETTGWRLPWTIDTVTKSAQPLVQGEFEAYPVALAPDGKSLIVHSTALHPARCQVYRLDVASGAMERLSPLDGDYGRPAVSEDTRRLAATFANWDSPVETYVLTAKAQRAVTDSHRPGAFAQVNKIRPRLIEFKNRHGQTVRAFVFLPPGWKSQDKRPAMVYTYGGPLGRGNSVRDGSFNTAGYLLNMYLAYAHGYVAVTVDPRGSSGYGAAFARASFGAVGVPQTEDLVDLAKHLVAEYGVDSERIALNGWSFGGWQTQHTMYTQPGVYTLGIAGAGPTEWQNYNQGYTQETIAVQPAGKTDVLEQFSLLKVAPGLRHPLLLVHGMDDENVLFLHTVRVYQVLLQHGLGPLVELVADPTGGHGLGGDISRRDTLAMYLRFVFKYWGSEPFNPKEARPGGRSGAANKPPGGQERPWPGEEVRGNGRGPWDSAGRTGSRPASSRTPGVVHRWAPAGSRLGAGGIQAGPGCTDAKGR
jgi:dipeptidyl aminopeptidase/acylaminoacyl peptidase